MWNLLGYISKKPNLQEGKNQEEEQEQKQICKISYENILTLHRQISKQQEKFDKAFMFPNETVVGTFEDLMGTLHGLLNVIEHIKEEIRQNEHKIQQYDHLKHRLQRHDEIIKQFQQRQENQLKEMLESRSQLEQKFMEQINMMKQQIKILTGDKNELQQTNKLISEENQKLKNELKALQSNYQILDATLIEKQNKLQRLLKLNNAQQNLIITKPENNEKVQKNSKIFSIQFSFKYQKIRKNIFQFLDVRQFANLLQVSRQMYFVCNRVFKTQFFPTLQQNMHKKYDRKMKIVKQSQKMFDKFPAQIIKSNAIKYLYFKLKPGAYIVPFISGDEKITEQIAIKAEKKQKAKQGNTKNKWSGLFGWKDDTKKVNKQQQESTVQPHKFSLDNLKNQNQFKQTQAKIDIFFDKLFRIEMPTDLHIFQQTMQKQLQQLKNYIRLNTGNNKAQQLLLLSKFLYLQTNQLNNLVQVCFALLINQHNQLVQYKQKATDLMESQKVLRDLIENLANQRTTVQKRLWELENEALRARSLMEKHEIKYSKVQRENSQQSQQLQKINKQLKEYKVIYEQQKKQRHKFEKQLKQFTKILSDYSGDVFKDDDLQ